MDVGPSPYIVSNETMMSQKVLHKNNRSVLMGIDSVCGVGVGHCKGREVGVYESGTAGSKRNNIKSCQILWNLP
jgi:hypothetical protein